MISQHDCKGDWQPCLGWLWFLGNAHNHGPQSYQTFLSAARSKKQYGLSTTWFLITYQVPYCTSPAHATQCVVTTLYTASNYLLRYLHTGTHTQTHAQIHTHMHTPIPTPHQPCPTFTTQICFRQHTALANSRSSLLNPFLACWWYSFTSVLTCWSVATYENPSKWPMNIPHMHLPSSGHQRHKQEHA